MVEVTVCEDGNKVIVTRRYNTAPEVHIVSLTELWHDKERLGAIFDAVIHVKEVKITEERSPEGSYVKTAVLKI